MRIGCSPRVILVPLSGPAVTTRVFGPPRVFLAAAARGGTEATRPARPPNRSARTTRNAAKMNSHSSSRKPKRKICSTISAVTGTRPASRAVLPVDQHRVADADDVAVGERLAGGAAAGRSGEGRVGKEGGSRWAPEH